jgi:hypothetical protein
MLQAGIAYGSAAALGWPALRNSKSCVRGYQYLMRRPRKKLKVIERVSNVESGRSLESTEIARTGIFPGICVWGCPIIAGGVNVQCFIRTPRTQGNRIGRGRWRVWGSGLEPRNKMKI